jgi:hypothetical protein
MAQIGKVKLVLKFVKILMRNLQLGLVAKIFQPEAPESGEVR